MARTEGGLPVDEKELTGGTLFGLSMFGTLFLGAVLAAFLTLGVVRGDAERGLLQPLVVRPVGRSALLLGRFLGAAAVCVPYVLAVYTACALITRTAGDWWPDQFLRPGLQLAAGVLVIAALGLLGSVVLSATANGIAIFMVFGAGLVAGLLGQIGEALNSETLQTVAHRTSWALPFEALYQDALYRITSESRGFTGLAIQLGPFGGSQAGGTNLPLWAIAYFAVGACRDARSLLAQGPLAAVRRSRHGDNARSRATRTLPVITIAQTIDAQTSLPAGVPTNRARAASTMVVNGLFAAMGSSQSGIVSTGTKAEETNVNGKRIVKPYALAASGEDAVSPMKANTQEKAYPNSSNSAMPAITSGAPVEKRKPTAIPTVNMTTSWIMFVPTSARIRPASTAGPHIGSERKRSISPFFRSSARPSAVTNPPKTIDWTMIPGIRKST